MQWGKIPPLGKFLSPQHGFWQNAEPADFSFDLETDLPELQDKAEIYFDEKLVPHIFAGNDHDAYFLQGYLHAKFRLFQMEIQTLAAEGRVSEMAGRKAIRFDREQRRLGMRYAAENALMKINQDKETRLAFDAYTDGVNAYIGSLKESQLPVEYKLLNFKPEKWTNLRSALFLKMMSKDLSSGTENDLAYTTAKSIFSREEMKILYPQIPDSLAPIVPKGTLFEQPGIVPVTPATADSLYLAKKETMPEEEVSKPDPDNGSNSWVVTGQKTASGAPILCNDPHLELSLPSIWYELQIVTPAYNAYGVSFPGAPFVIIGFNDSIAWGATNSQRDVKDYYEIKFRDDSKKEYWFNGKWEPTRLRPEVIKVKGELPFFDTVAYTVFGPVMYDKSFSDAFSNERNLAVRWTAHDPSNEGATFYKLNRAKNYEEYEEAINGWDCPGQNFVFASKSGDIAIWQQGKFPARWDRQGLYVMPGQDSSYMWQGYIAKHENPHSFNPEQQFLVGANQRPADSSYPYFIPGSYINPRSITIDRNLSAMSDITPKDMMVLQNNYFNTMAEDMVPLLLQYVNENGLNNDSKRYLEMVKSWNLLADPESKGQTIYQCWFDSLRTEIWNDELTRTNPVSPLPEEQTTMELLKRDPACKYVDNINTPEVETLYDDVTAALKKAAAELVKKEQRGELQWDKFKKPAIYHLLKELTPFSHLDLPVGGYGNIINAITHSHGPSWRMVVQLTEKTEAYGIYPGGQSGNPGSKYYENFLDQWVRGSYNMLYVLHTSDRNSDKVKWKMTFTKQ